MKAGSVLLRTSCLQACERSRFLSNPGPCIVFALFKKKKKKKDKNLFVYLGLLSGQGQRPFPACPKGLTGWEGAGKSICQEIQRICHSCDSDLFQKQANFDDSLKRSHPRSFLERIELQESGARPRHRQRAFSARQAGLQSGRQARAIVCGPHPHSPPAVPRRIASFKKKKRKLSSQVRAFDFP